MHRELQRCLCLPQHWGFSVESRVGGHASKSQLHLCSQLPASTCLTQVLESHPMQEAWIEFLAPGFDRARSWLADVGLMRSGEGSELSDRRSLSRPLCFSNKMRTNKILGVLLLTGWPQLSVSQH